MILVLTNTSSEMASKILIKGLSNQQAIEPEIVV